MTGNADVLDLQRDERSRRARQTGRWGVIYQGVYAVAQLVGLGMIARYVGDEQYGLWMTVLAVASWMPLANLGQTSVLLSKLGALAFTDKRSADRTFCASTVLVTTVAVVLIALLALGGPLLPWAHLLNAHALTAGGVGTIVGAALLVSLAALPAGMGAFAVFAHQRGDLVHQLMSAASLLSLISAGIAIWFRQPLWVVGALTLCGPLLGGIALWATGLALELVPRIRRPLFDGRMLGGALADGFTFALIDATTLVFLRTPDVLVAHLHGVAAVGPFASVGRLPLLMMAVSQALLLPYWPALCDAAQRGDHAWVRQMIVRTLVIIVGLWTIGALGIWFFGAFFIRQWTASTNFSSPALLGAACIVSLGLGLFGWVSVLFSVFGRQRQLVLASLTACALYLPLAFLLGKQFGPVGVALAQAATLLGCAVPLGSWLLRRELRATRLS